MQQFDYYSFTHSNSTTYLIATSDHKTWRCLTGRVSSEVIEKAFEAWSEGQGEAFKYLDSLCPSLHSDIVVKMIEQYTEKEVEKRMAVSKARGKRLNDKTKGNIISLLDSGVKVSYICERFNVSRPTVYKLKKAA